MKITNHSRHPTLVILTVPFLSFFLALEFYFISSRTLLIRCETSSDDKLAEFMRLQTLIASYLSIISSLSSTLLIVQELQMVTNKSLYRTLFLPLRNRKYQNELNSIRQQILSVR